MKEIATKISNMLLWNQVCFPFLLDFWLCGFSTDKKKKKKFIFWLASCNKISVYACLCCHNMCPDITLKEILNKYLMSNRIDREEFVKKKLSDLMHYFAHLSFEMHSILYWNIFYFNVLKCNLFSASEKIILMTPNFERLCTCLRYQFYD